MRSNVLLISVCIVFIIHPVFSQIEPEYVFTTVYEVPTTSVKQQGRSGTCWSFSTTSFLETEILRLSGEEHNFSEMYFVYYTYLNKARQYIRFHGTNNFSEGGQAHDVLNVVDKYGLVNEKDYPGKKAEQDMHNHTVLENKLKTYLDSIASIEDKIDLEWIDEVNEILQMYLGKLPEKIHSTEEITPQTYFSKTGLDLNNYIEITSFMHHPFYEQFILEIPDNWALQKYYNIPLDELMAIIDNSLKNGISVLWDGDATEQSYNTFIGIATIPNEEMQKLDKLEFLKAIEKPHTEQKITQKLRQKSFDNQTSTDDHLMHITGLVKDQTGTKFYKTKNSWGKETGPYEGYIYLSEAYVKYKTIAIMVHKDAVPEDIAEKIGLD